MNVRPITETRQNRIREVLARRQRDFTLVLDNIWDPHNASAILRSCDAFGVFKVHLYYTTEKWPEIGHKSSGSGRKWVEREAHSGLDSLMAALSGLGSGGCQILRTGFSDRSRPLHAFDFTRPTAIILGNEHRGVSPELAALVPDEMHIPMQGMIPSLNVSVASAVILYEAYSQRRAAGLFDRPSLSGEEMEALERAWAERAGCASRLRPAKKGREASRVSGPAPQGGDGVPA